MSLSRRIEVGAVRFSITAISVVLGLAACGGGSDDPVPPQQAKSFVVAKAQCGTGDTQETGLQGQVPLPAQVGGFKGFNCNLQPVSATPSARGEGVFGMFALMHDKSGHTCGYTSGAFDDSYGMSVVDLTDPTKAVETAVLMTPGVIQTGESLRVHEGRGLSSSPTTTTTFRRKQTSMADLTCTTWEPIAGTLSCWRRRQILHFQVRG
jgi:hypothetical protein